MGVYAFFVSSGVGRSGPTPNRRRLDCPRAGRKTLAADRPALAHPAVTRNFRRLPTSVAHARARIAHELDQLGAADDHGADDQSARSATPGSNGGEGGC